jgi:hypothetical protein
MRLAVATFLIAGSASAIFWRRSRSILEERRSAESAPEPDHFFVACGAASRRRSPGSGNPLMMPSISTDADVRSQLVKKKLAREGHLAVDESLATVAPYVG